MPFVPSIDDRAIVRGQDYEAEFRVVGVGHNGRSVNLERTAPDGRVESARANRTESRGWLISGGQHLRSVSFRPEAI